MHRTFCSVLAVLVIVASCSYMPAQSVQYNVVPLGSPYGSDAVLGNDINTAGTLPLTAIHNGQHQPFIWRNGKAIPLALLGGTCGSAVGINYEGHVVGAACLPGETVFHAYVYYKGVTQDLGTFGGASAAGTGINRYGKIAGIYGLSDGTEHSFYRTRRGWTDLGNLGGSFTWAAHLNDSAVVTGQSDVSNDPDPVFGIPPFHGFQWSGGVLTDFGQIFGSNFNYGFGINNAGMIAGAADVAGDVAAHAIIWYQGTVQDLSPYDNISAGGVGINNLGDVVGSWGSVDPDPADGPPVDAMLCPCYAVLWQNGQTIFLNDVVSPDWNLWLALAINDRGEILARGQFDGGKLETVLLKPVKTASHFVSGVSPNLWQRGLTYPLSAPRRLQRQPGFGYREIR
jgi:probable HAF family extracellular repeat protein